MGSAARPVLGRARALSRSPARRGRGIRVGAPRVGSTRATARPTDPRLAAADRLRSRGPGASVGGSHVRERGRDRALAPRVRALLAWLDSTPLAALALEAMREATGRAEPLEPLRPARPAALPERRRVAFWSLTAGVGASTTAALVAHRSAGAGRAPVLLDLDRWSPPLALRAGVP